MNDDDTVSNLTSLTKNYGERLRIALSHKFTHGSSTQFPIAAPHALRQRRCLAAMSLLLVSSSWVGEVVSASAAPKFTRFVFDNNASIELPFDWRVTEQDSAQSLSERSDSIARELGLQPLSGPNVVYISARSPRRDGTRTASIRLSARVEDGPGQTAMRFLDSMSKDELRRTMEPMLADSLKGLGQVPGTKRVRVTDLRVAKNPALSCLLAEFEYELQDGTRTISRTYTCPMGRRLIKMTTSNPAAEDGHFRPLIDRIWQSLYAR